MRRRTNTPELDPLRISWSGIQTYLACQRRYELSYEENLKRKPHADQRDMVLGSAFHAGIQAALLTSLDAEVMQHVMTEEWLLEAAVAGARTYLRNNTVNGKMVRDWSAGGLLVTDVHYYAMMREVSVLVVELLRYHIPLIGLGRRFIVPTVDDVLSGQPPTYRESETYRNEDANWPNIHPAVEWKFEYPMDEATTLTGLIDTILWDVEQQQYVLVDWKTRKAFPADNAALLDGQLHLYAAVVNALAEGDPINQVVMWQMKANTPKPATMSEKTGAPNTGAKSYDSTWEVWSASLPMGIKAEKYESLMRPKLKTDEDFQRPIYGAVSHISSELALGNAYSAANSIRLARANRPMPAILSSYACKACAFAPLCGNALRYGGDAEPTLSDLYEARKVEEELEDDEAVE